MRPKKEFWMVLLIIIFCITSAVLGMKLTAEVKSRGDSVKVYNKATEEKNIAITELEDMKVSYTSLQRQCSQIKKLNEVREDALLSYIRKKFTRVSTIEAQEIARQTVLISAELNAPFEVIVGIMQVESAFSQSALSSAGARGLMQVMPLWVKEFDFLERQTDLHEIDKGIRAGTKVLLTYYRSEKSLSKALVKYLGGDESSYKLKVLNAVGEFTMHMTEDK